MIQFKRKLYGLSKLQYDYVDTDPRSRNIFRILEMPETFNLGKNQFKLLVNNKFLLRNSKIYIDIVDANGNPIYHEISPIVNKDNSRSVIVYVYSDTPPGVCHVHIAGRLFIDPRNNDEIFFNESLRNEPNVLWSGIVNVSVYEEPNTRIQFIRDPIVRYTERITPLQTISGSSRLVNLNGTGNITMRSVISPVQLNPSSLDIERSAIQPIVVTSNQLSGSALEFKNVEIPRYFDVSVIRAENFVFSSSMVGGTIYVNKINVEYPPEVVNTESFYNLSYSASIVNVLNSDLIEVYPSYQKTFLYNTARGERKLYTVNSFSGHTNFTTSFHEIYDLTASLTTQSFLELSAYGTEPITGKPKYLNVSYKTVNSFGDFQNVGDFEIVRRNLLVDSASISFDAVNGITEKSIGTFPNGLSDFEQYWDSGSIGNLVFVVYDGILTKIKVNDGLFTRQQSGSLEQCTYLKPKPRYSVYAYENTEFELAVSSMLEVGELDNKRSQIDVYISGSDSIFSDIGNQQLLYSPIKSKTLGTYIGSIAATNGSLRDDKISFLVKSTSNITPVFALRSGQWHFGNIELVARINDGYAPNQTKIYVPLTDVTRESELIFRVRYKNGDGIPASNETKLSGLYFQGSSPIQFDEISNVPANIGMGTDMNYGNVWTKNYITQSSAQVNNTSSIFNVQFPVFINEVDDSIYTASIYAVGMGFQIETVIFGKTGSISAPYNTHIWGGTVQGRAILSSTVNSGTPLLYNVMFLSGSSVNQLGTFGSEPLAVTPLDGWFTLNAISVANSNRDIRIRYSVLPTSSFFWDLECVSTCKVWKYEKNVLT